MLRVAVLFCLGRIGMCVLGFFLFLRNRLRAAHRNGAKVKLNPMKTDGSFHGRASSLPCEIPLLHPARHMTVFRLSKRRMLSAGASALSRKQPRPKTTFQM